MKKLTMLIMMLLSSMALTTVYAADVSTDNDLGIVDDDNNDDLGSLLDETTDETDDTTDTTNNEKVNVTVNSTTSNSISLKIDALDNYTNYKVYYNKEGSDNISEKEVSSDNDDLSNVTIDNLEANTTYEIVVKAFDSDGNPVEATASEPVKATTEASQDEQHAAPSDNVIYNPVIKSDGDKITISYKPGADVKKVQISISEDGGKTFKPVTVIDASTTTYTIKTDKTGEKFVKIVPVAEDGTLGVCKIGATEVQSVKVTVKPVKATVKTIGKSKTGPELYLLVIFAILAYVVYARRRLKA